MIMIVNMIIFYFFTSPAIIIIIMINGAKNVAKSSIKLCVALIHRWNWCMTRFTAPSFDSLLSAHTKQEEEKTTHRMPQWPILFAVCQAKNKYHIWYTYAFTMNRSDRVTIHQKHWNAIRAGRLLYVAIWSRDFIICCCYIGIVVQSYERFVSFWRKHLCRQKLYYNRCKLGYVFIRSSSIRTYRCHDLCTINSCVECALAWKCACVDRVRVFVCFGEILQIFLLRFLTSAVCVKQNFPKITHEWACTEHTILMSISRRSRIICLRWPSLYESVINGRRLRDFNTIREICN